MGLAADAVLKSIQDVAIGIVRSSGSDRNINYAGLHGLHPDIWNLPCGCSLAKGNGALGLPGSAERKVPSVHILGDGAVVHLACGKEIARIERREPIGGI
ncbi:MAG: hypothetical protein RL681_314 [Candidatus Parcubacteria bacterium]|jgi:hypothetical protein